MKNINKSFYKYITLGILGMLGASGTIFIDTFFVSNRLGTNGLTALNIAIAIFGLMSGLGLMLGVGGATIYSIYKAQNQSKRANEIFSLAFLNALILGLILFILGLFGAPFLARILGAKDLIFSLCETYIKTVLCFGPFFIINYLMMSFIRNDGNPKLATLMMIVCSLTNIIFDYLFLYPLNMGIFGAALATGLSPIFSLIVGLLHFICHKNKMKLTSFKYSFKKTINIIKPGLSTFINELSSSLVLVVFNLLILKIAGNIGVAAYGIVANLGLIVVAIFSGITQGIQPLLSEAYGLGDSKALKIILKKSLIVVLILGILVHLSSIFGASLLVDIFNSEGDTILQQWAEEGLVTYFIGFILAGLNYIIVAYFSVVRRTTIAFSISLFKGFIGIIVFALVLGNLVGLYGIWLTFPIVEFFTLIASLLSYQRDYKLSNESITSIYEQKAS